MIFSHGLGGSRNAYSQILGTLASHGIIVIAPDHRDSSAPISYIRATESTPARTVGYRKMPHTPTPDVYAGRDNQLKIRLWEMGLIHDAVVKMEEGHYPENLDPNSSSPKKRDRNNVLKMFVGQLDVYRPGAIVWGGHSFGAATTVQLVKSTYWQTSAEKKIPATPIYNPSASSKLANQITPSSPVILLDMWCLPFRSPETKTLWEQPMPCYAPAGPGGTALLSISSEAFFKWNGNMKDTNRVISPPRGLARPMAGPKSFYPRASAHLSQSDFGVLFPWVTQRFLKTDNPELYIKLNARAILQTLRENGYDLANSKAAAGEQQEDATSAQAQKKGVDWRILDSKGGISGWNAIDLKLDLAGTNATVENDVQSPSDTVETEVLGEVNQ
jgi:platelet-activating factor acetylhydrolase